jgi:iron-sulfur cluster assembly accessory protein
MITLTDLAAGQLKNLLQQKSLLEHGLRVFVHGGGCAGLQYGMAFEDTKQEGDMVLEVKGVRLFVDRFSADYLEGACIDYEDTPMGSGFRVDNPNAIATCACGTSFRTEVGREVQQSCKGI